MALAPLPLAPAELPRWRPAVGAGLALPQAERRRFEPLLGTTLGDVRVHLDPAARAQAAALRAQAFTWREHVVFGPGHGPGEPALLAHELAHVAQQRQPAAARPGAQALEQQAEHMAAATLCGRRAAPAAAAVPGIQRRIEMRDVGPREFSGMARLQQLVDRMTEVSPSLIFNVEGGVLTYEAVPGLEPNEFDRQMMAFIDSERVLPMRLTDRHGLTRGGGGAFTDRVFADNWSAGYVDIDDLLASSALGMQTILVHFLQERLSTRNYARRMGSTGMNLVLGDPAVQAEFNRVHQRGLDAEVRLLRDFFGDPSVRLVPGAESGNTARVFTNDRRDRIRTRVSAGSGAAGRGVDAVSIDVVLRGTTAPISAEEYRDLLQREREQQAAAAEEAAERLNGAAEHRAGGRAIPAP